MKNKITLATLLLLLFVGSFTLVWGQIAAPAADRVSAPTSAGDSLHQIGTEIYFRLGDGHIDPDFEGNKFRLSLFNDALQKVLADPDYVVNRVVVVGTSSPDGRQELNDSLAGRRAESLADYLKAHTSVPSDKIEVVNGGENWEGLRQMIEASDKMPYKAKMLELMSIPNQRTRKLRMMYYADSKPWLWMYDHLFSQLRISAGGAQAYATLNGSRVTCSYELSAEAKLRATDSLAGQQPVADTPSDQTVAQETLPADAAPLTTATAPGLKRIKTDPKRVLFALKTNLLFDLATAVNLGVEVPLGRRWSLSAEAVFPQWNFNNRTSMIVTEFSIEPRLWLGNRETLRSGKKRNTLTGHFVGVYGNYVDNYDLQWGHKGVMGSGYGVGLTYGYAHRLGRSFNIEYSIGVGALYLDNKSFDVSDNYDYKILRKEGSGWHFLPTRARVSLVWLIGNTRNKSK